jgi:hypothetical protein
MSGFVGTFLYNLCWSQSITRAHNKWLFKTRSILVLVLSRPHSPVSILPQLPASELDSLISTLHGPYGKHILYCWQSLFIAPLPRNRCPVVPRVCSCGNLFSEPLPSNGHAADHMENNSWNTFSIVDCENFGRYLEMGLPVTIFNFRSRWKKTVDL